MMDFFFGSVESRVLTCYTIPMLYIAAGLLCSVEGFFVGSIPMICTCSFLFIDGIIALIIGNQIFKKEKEQKDEREN